MLRYPHSGQRSRGRHEPLHRSPRARRHRRRRHPAPLKQIGRSLQHETRIQHHYQPKSSTAMPSGGATATSTATPDLIDAHVFTPSRTWSKSPNPGGTRPPQNAIIGRYILHPAHLPFEGITPGAAAELQLTDAIKALLQRYEGKSTASPTGASPRRRRQQVWLPPKTVISSPLKHPPPNWAPTSAPGLKTFPAVDLQNTVKNSVHGNRVIRLAVTRNSLTPADRQAFKSTSHRSLS